nr:retrovirus-related Pol polyprotein from transposon TNT 1-94 [Tanacetum cinerariifolium]
MSSIEKFDVKKFDGSNDFGFWCVKMWYLLIQHGWEVALDPFPRTMEDVEKTTTLKTNVYKKAHSKKLSEHIDEFNKLNGDLANIDVDIDDEHQALMLLMSLPSSYDNLVETLLYGRESLTLEDVFHIDEFNKLILDLANIDIEIEDEHQALMLLTLFLSSYENFVETLLYGRETLTMGDVLATLNSRELKKRTKGTKEETCDRLYVRERSDRSSKAHSDRSLGFKLIGGTSKLNCFICNSDGHLKRDCPMKKSSGFVKKGKRDRDSDFSDNEGNAYFREALVVVGNDEMTELVIDSGRSYHMTHMRDFLYDFKVIDGGSFQLGDNRTCIVKGTWKGTQWNREDEVFQVTNDDPVVAQRWLEDKQLKGKTNTACLGIFELTGDRDEDGESPNYEIGDGDNINPWPRQKILESSWGSPILIGYEDENVNQFLDKDKDEDGDEAEKRDENAT